jgi:hypothetical protein
MRDEYIFLLMHACYFYSLLPSFSHQASEKQGHVPLAPDAATAGKPMPGKVESPQLYKPLILIFFGL